MRQQACCPGGNQGHQDARLCGLLLPTVRGWVPVWEFRPWQHRADSAPGVPHSQPLGMRPPAHR